MSNSLPYKTGFQTQLSSPDVEDASLMRTAKVPRTIVLISTDADGLVHAIPKDGSGVLNILVYFLNADVGYT